MDEVTHRTQIPLTLEAPRQARAWIQGAVSLTAEAGDIVLLLLSELVANSVRHSGMPPAQLVQIFVRQDGDALHVEVSDPGPGNGIEPQESPEHSGLRIVDSLADRWGVTQDPTVVWFDVNG